MDNKILVIDDDDLARESIVAYLSDSNFDVLEASGGEEGIRRFKEQKPSLVISDLKMPVMDGINVLEELQRIDPEISVVVISGAGAMQDVVRALRSGAFDYLIKPILDLHVLEHSVQKGLERTRLFRENRRYREALERTNHKLAENLLTLERDQAAAKQVQLSFFPKPTQVHSGFSFSHEVKPSLYLSGDFVNYFEIDQTRIGFYLADVSGHGASSALVTLMLKNFTDRLQRRFLKGMDRIIIDPGLTLSAINHEMLSLDIDKHLAMIFGIIDTSNQVLSYSVGAHFPPPILVTKDGGQYLSGRGLPIGLFPEATYEVGKVPLSESFLLFLCTDGILEVMPQAGIEKKQQLLLEKISQGYHTLSALLKVLGVTDVTDLPDDIAIMTARKGVITY